MPASLPRLSPGLAEAVSIMGRPRCLHVILALGTPARFNEVKGRVPGLSSKTLSSSLRFLSRLGIVGSAPATRSSPHLRYGLTPKGREFAELLVRLRTVLGPQSEQLAVTPGDVACGEFAR